MLNQLNIEPRNMVAEAVGAFALIFVGAGSVIVTGGTNLVGIAIAHGLAIALLVSALGHVSGGLFNPALTIGLWVTRQMDTINTVAYIIAQLVGAVLGAVALVLLFPEVMRKASSLGTPVLNPGINFAQGVGIEAILTIFLMLAVFGTAIEKRGQKIGGFGVGLVLTMSILAAGPLTGGYINPARAFGPALLAGEWANHLAYWIGPIIGAVLAAMLYQYVFSDEPLVAVAEAAAPTADEAFDDEAPIEATADAPEEESAPAMDEVDELLESDQPSESDEPAEPEEAGEPDEPDEADDTAGATSA